MSTAELSDVKIENITDRIKPYAYSSDVRVPGYAQRTGKFFFQEEAGIRDVAVTGVQTCALPICAQPPFDTPSEFERRLRTALRDPSLSVLHWSDSAGAYLDGAGQPAALPADGESRVVTLLRSEERRVGKECRSRWAPYH